MLFRGRGIQRFITLDKQRSTFYRVFVLGNKSSTVYASRQEDWNNIGEMERITQEEVIEGVPRNVLLVSGKWKP